MFVNLNILFESGIYNSYYGIYEDCRTASTYMLKKYDREINCNSDDMILMSLPDYYSITDLIIGEYKFKKLMSLDETEIINVIKSNVRSEYDRKLIIEKGFDEYERRKLMREGSVGEFSSEAGMSFFVDIFFLIVFFTLQTKTTKFKLF